MNTESVVAFVLADIALVAVLARLVGALFVKLRQPPVIGEILVGIALGPSLLGLVFADAPSLLFPPQARPHLELIAQLGLVLFMFLIGLEFDTALIRGQGKIAVTVSMFSVALPFGFGGVLAIWLYQNHAPPERSIWAFALFVGASMAVTAFPVLARILRDRGMYRTRIGSLAMACAASDDVLAWTLLAAAAGIASSDGVGNLPVVAGGAAVFVAVTALVVRRLMALLIRRYEQAGRLDPGIMIAITGGALLSAGATSAIGIHAIFGAFLFGALLPRKGAEELIRDLRQRLEPISLYLLLPVFFVVTGVHVDVAGIDGAGWLEFAAVLAVACLSKFLGASGTARVFGISWRRSAALGVLMNTRGLTELVILSVGRDLGLIDDQLFTIMVLMALVTTVIAEPLLRLVYPAQVLAQERFHSSPDVDIDGPRARAE